MRIAGIALAAVLLAGAASAASSPGYRATVSAVKWAELRHTYRAGCPVKPRDLRTVRLRHWGFDGKVHEGALVVHRTAAADVVAAFRAAYRARFPIRRMEPISAFRGDDDASMAADNTSGFNCRFVGGTRRWSMHAYGLAVDVNPRENPYVVGGRVSPPAGRRYLDRSDVRPGMHVPGGPLVRAFEARGWGWGGRWSGSLDLHHFSTTGR